MENPNRLRTKLMVSLFPGIHLRKLQKLLDASFSTTRYHVENLKRDGQIVCSKDRRFSRLYLPGVVEGERALYIVLQNPKARRIVRALMEHPMTNGELADRVRMPKSTVSDYLDLLKKVQIIRRSVQLHGRVLYEVQNRYGMTPILASFEKNLAETLTDGFLDTWDL